MPKRSLLYLVTRENVLAPGVLKSQVLGLAGQIKKEWGGVDILVLNFPSVHSFLKHFRNYRSVRDYVSTLGIKLVIIPILPIGRSIMPIWALPFLFIQTIPFVLFFLARHRTNVILARGHISALLAVVLKKLGARIKFIFEVHGPYLIEGEIHGRWVPSDFSYKAWEIIERRLFVTADHVIARSLGILEYVKHASPRSRVSIIPCSVNERLFSVTIGKRKEMRSRMGVGDRFVVVYAGSLGSFHRPDFLADFYFQLRKNLLNPFFLVVTHSPHEGLIQNLKKRGIHQEEFMVVSNPPKLSDFLPLGDVALHIYDDSPIAPFALSAKIAEYMAAGLPVIVTKNIYSATGLVEDNQVGVVIDPFDQKDIRVKMQQLVKEREAMKRNALKLAKDYFSVKVCAKKYLDIYDELVQKNKL